MKSDGAGAGTADPASSWCVRVRPLTEMPELWTVDLARHSRREQILLRWVHEADQATVKHWLENTDHDISDHRPDKLRVIDRSLDESFRSVAMSSRRRYETNFIGIGCFLGEVVVRNLGGRWHFPSGLQARAVMWSRRPALLEKYMYVAIPGRGVRVIQAARHAIDETAKVFSLYEFYSGFAGAPLPPEGG